MSSAKWRLFRVVLDELNDALNHTCIVLVLRSWWKENEADIRHNRDTPVARYVNANFMQNSR